LMTVTTCLYHDNDTKARKNAQQRADEERSRRQAMHDAMEEAERGGAGSTTRPTPRRR